MDQPADFSVEQGEGGRAAVLTGDWTSIDLGDAGKRLRQELRDGPPGKFDLTRIGRFDSAGALAVVVAAGGTLTEDAYTARPETARLLDLVARAMETEPPPPPVHRGFYELLERLGRSVIGIGHDVYDTLEFNGRLLVAIARLARHPGRIRWAASINLAERAGIDALPIVAVATFFIGAVVGLLGEDMLKQFGAQIFVVELIGVAVMREFAIIITAVLLAGRSASSFAAEIGAMKMNQEIDAMQVMGVDPFEALVLPRFLALLFAIPLLTFVAALAGLAGGMLVTWMALDLSPAFFLQRILDNVGPKHFWIGLSKAPVMAIVIAAIGCRQGMEVGGDVESLGRRVTAAVVHAIFSIIFLDAVFAVMYMELNV